MAKKKELNTSDAKRERIELISGVGKEPFFDGLMWTQLDLVKALNYYAMHTDFSQMKEWALEFVTKHKPELLSKVKSAPETSFMTYGPLCRLHDRGFDFDSVMLCRVFDYFDSFKFPEREERSKLKTDKVSKSQEAFDGSLDKLIVGGQVEFPVLDSSENLKGIKAYCQREISCIRDYPDYFNPLKIQDLKKFFVGVGDRIDEILSSKKKLAPVVQKRKTPVEIVKSVKFQKTEPKLKLVSINPIEILDKRKMYVYDTEKRRLIKYVAGGANFTFTGTTLHNFDPEKSFSKTIRKPEEFFHGRDLSISALNRAFDAVKAVEKPIETGRFSDTFMILNKS